MAAATVVYDCSCCLLRTIINCQLSLVVLPFVVPKVGIGNDLNIIVKIAIIINERRIIIKWS